MELLLDTKIALVQADPLPVALLDFFKFKVDVDFNFNFDAAVFILRDGFLSGCQEGPATDCQDAEEGPAAAVRGLGW